MCCDCITDILIVMFSYECQEILHGTSEIFRIKLSEIQIGVRNCVSLVARIIDA